MKFRDGVPALLRAWDAWERPRGDSHSPAFLFSPGLPGPSLYGGIAARDALSAKTGGKTSQFRYLLPQTENAAHESDEQDVEI